MANQYEIYYHLTDQKNVAGIMLSGLKPRKGTHSQYAQEETDAVYLCKYQDIHGWRLALQVNRLIYLRIPKTFAKQHITKTQKFGYYSPHWEYRCDCAIPLEYIRKTVNFPVQKPESKRHQSKDIIYDLSFYVVELTRYLDKLGIYPTKQDPDYEERLADDGRTLTRYLKAIDLTSTETVSAINDMLKDLSSDGEYTLQDVYEDTEIPLWEHLQKRELPDILNKPVKHMIQTLKQTLPDSTKQLDTGGYENPYK